MKRQIKVLAIMTLVIAFTSCGSSKETTKNKTGRQKTEHREQGNGQRPDASQIIARMDVNKDGRISRSEAKGKLKENFDRRDKNNDGYITEDELTAKKR